MLVRSIIQTDSLPEALEWLLDCKDPLPCFWDLDGDVSLVLKLLPETNLKELAETNKTSLIVAGLKYNLLYIRTKLFMVAKGYGYLYVNPQLNSKVIYYGLAQFAQWDYRKDTLPSLAEQQAFGEQLLSELARVKIYPKRLTSVAAISDYIYEKINLPSYKDYPDEVNQLAWEITGRAYTECHKIGYWKEAVDYDIKSSYPSKMSALVDTRYGRWYSTKDYQVSAYYGIIRTVVKHDLKVCPYSVVAKNGEVYFPSGEYETVFTKELGDVMRKHYPAQNGFIKEIKEAWWWRPNHAVVKPLDIAIRTLFNNRSLSPFLNRIMKMAMVSSYGRLLQLKKENGKTILADTFNPFWACQIEDSIKAQVADFLYSNTCGGEPSIEHLIHISTDGVTLDSPVDKEIIDTKIGGWKQDSTGECLVLSTGNMFYGKRKPKQLSITETLEMIKTHPYSRRWYKTVRRRMTLGDTMVSRCVLGEIKDVETGVELSLEHDRHFPELPSSGKQLLKRVYNSQPIKIKYLH